MCKHLETNRSPKGLSRAPSIHMSREKRHLAWDNSLDPAVWLGPGTSCPLIWRRRQAVRSSPRGGFLALLDKGEDGDQGL